MPCRGCNLAGSTPWGAVTLGVGHEEYECQVAEGSNLLHSKSRGSRCRHHPLTLYLCSLWCQDADDCQEWTRFALEHRKLDFMRDLPLRALAVADDAVFTMPDLRADQTQLEVSKLARASHQAFGMSPERLLLRRVTDLRVPLPLCTLQDRTREDGADSFLSPVLEALVTDSSFQALMSQAAG